ncbi:phosphotransferase, partial [Deinococcus sp.]|uniref:phosphotransferase n=1 Tax=Deinococcus sp. TaxID=47478 RepID=UPI0028699D6A
MSADDALTILNFLDDSPTAVPGVLRQGEILVRYAQPGTPASDRIRRDAEMLLALAPHGLPGPELLELDLGGRRVKHAFSLQRLPHPEAVLGRGGLVSTDKGETGELWQQVGAYLRRLHD